MKTKPICTDEKLYVKELGYVRCNNINWARPGNGEWGNRLNVRTTGQR